MADSGAIAAGTGGKPAQPREDAGNTSTEDAGIKPVDAGQVPTRVFDAGSDPLRNQVVGGQVCARLAQIQCAGEAFCCDAPGRDVATCEVGMRDVCINTLHFDAVTANPITAFSAERATTVFTTLEDLASRCDPTIAAYGGSPEGLPSMLFGTIAQGDSCSPGITTDKQRWAAALASCTNIETTACLPHSEFQSRCEARTAIGGLCFTDLNCHTGLYCPNPDFRFGETYCETRKAIGAPCQTANECATLFCKSGACVEGDRQAAYCLSN